ncbi:MAG TPA: DUF3488 and transglutaminase-like domain-containing protein, partial [Bryobacteraceae bacterium]|nr:DUF3488 and transglutaminase-like domain-containing protein [Bryobacteraceae bacterium]
MIFFLAVIRILTARTNRDYFFVKVIAFLELLAATVLTDSWNFLLFLVLFVVFGVATFCCSEIRNAAQKGRRIIGGPGLFGWRLGALTASVTIGIFVLTGGLFFLLPRTARAALRNFVPARYHVVGFSNQVTLGEVGEVKQVSTPMFHVRIEEPYSQSSLKWRGAALTQFDGRRWYNPGDIRAKAIDVEKNRLALAGPQPVDRSRRLNYEVTINAIGTNTLFFAGVPHTLNINTQVVLRGTGDSYRAGYPMASGGLNYTVEAYREDLGSPPTPLRTALPVLAQVHHLALPEIDPRIVDLSRQLTAGQAPRAKAATLRDYLRNNYSYTLELLDKPVSDPLAHFLFERRRGHCEYFASALAVMLRTVNIPSRVVTGFQGGVYNPLTGWQVIRASDAHSWVEAYLPEIGWTTLDSTPPDLNAHTRSGILHHLALYFDAADTFWQQWVMNYDTERQVSLASQIDRSWNSGDHSIFARANDSLRSLISSGRKQAEYYAATGLLVFLLAGGLVLGGPRCWRFLLTHRQVRRLKKGNIAPSDAALLYARMLEILRRRGYEKPAWLTPAEFARILPPSDYSGAVSQITAS